MMAWHRFTTLRGTASRLLVTLMIMVGLLQLQVPLYASGTSHAAALRSDRAPYSPSTILVGHAANNYGYRAGPATAHPLAGMQSQAPKRPLFTLGASIGLFAPAVSASTRAPGVLAAATDTTPPVTTYAVDNPPNAAGWVSGPVKVTLTATDDLALATTYYAIDQPCSPQNTTSCSAHSLCNGATCTSDTTQVQVSGDGRHQLAFFSVDQAGNVEHLHILFINIDMTPPHTQISLSGTVPPAVITLDATDTLSGVAATYYLLDDGESTTYTAPITITTTGTHRILFYSVDKAGNVEGNNNDTFTLTDASATPTSSATPSITNTPTVTASPSVTATPSASATATATPSVTATTTATRTATATRTSVPTITPTPTPQPTVVLPSFATGNVFAGVGGNRISVYDPTGHLLQVLDTGTNTAQEKGTCLDSGANMYVANFDSHTISKFNRHGQLVNPHWAGPFTAEPRNAEGCAVDAHDHLFFGLVDSQEDKHLGELREYNPDGTMVHLFHPQVGDRGIDWIDLAHDGCTLLYTSEGATIKRFNVCTGTQLPDLAGGLEPPCYALRQRPNDEVMVACYNSIYRLSAAGHVLHRYTRANLGEREHFFALNLDPDGTSFWTAGDLSGNIYRVDILTGRVITHFAAPPFQLLGGLAVYGEITAVAPSLTVAGFGVANSATGVTQPIAPGVTGGAGAARGAISGGETVRLALNAAPNAQIDAELQIVTSQKTTLTVGGKTSQGTRQVVIYQKRIQGSADANGHFQGDIPVAYMPRTDTSAQIIVHARVGRVVATRTIRLVIHPALSVSVQAAPQSIHTGQGVRVSVHTAPRARVTVVLTVYGVTRAKGQSVPPVLWRVQRSGTAGPAGGYTATIVVAYKAKQPVHITAVAQVQLGGRSGHAQVQLTLLPASSR